MTTPDPNPALDGSTTALHRRIEELTAELGSSRYKGCGSVMPDLHNSGCAAVQIESLKSRVAALTAELAEIAHLREDLDFVKQQNEQLYQSHTEAQTDLATERAAREQAEESLQRFRVAVSPHAGNCSMWNPALGEGPWDRICDCGAPDFARHEERRETAQRTWEGAIDKWHAKAEQAERERDTALAREKTAERLLGEERLAKVAAESALASARALLKRAHHWVAHPVIRSDVDAWLTSHPAPVADHPVSQDCVMLGCPGVVVEDEPAPCPGCASLSKAIDQAIRDMLSGGHPFEKGVAKAINDLRDAQKEHP